MKTILIIGIGPGDPGQITVQAARAIESADLFFLFDKGKAKSELIELRAHFIDRYGKANRRLVEADSPQWSSEGPDYSRIVDDLNARKTELIRRLIAAHLQDGERGAILVWGDPSLYDSTVRILESIAAADDTLAYEVIPGISSLQALAARHCAPWNGVGGDVAITTGRRLAEALPDAGTIIVMLDARNTFLKHLGKGLIIRYGAYVGMPDEILIEGPLDAVAQEIVERRAEARARKGWIMDSYMLTRPAH